MYVPKPSTLLRLLSEVGEPIGSPLPYWSSPPKVQPESAWLTDLVRNKPARTSALHTSNP